MRSGALQRCKLEAPAVLVLVAVAAIHVAILLLDHKTYFAAPDNSTQFWAWYQKAAATLHAGSLPLWDANTLAGHSFVGETQTGVFYPLNIFWLLVFGSAHGISARRLDTLVVLHLWLASVGFYALARSFRTPRLPAVIAGVVFAYTGVVFSRTGGQTAIFFGLALVPWAVFFAHRELETGRLRYAIGAGVAIGLGVLAGHLQPPFHAMLIVLLFYALAAPRDGTSWRSAARARLAAFATTVGVAVVVALPQLAYSLPYLNRAYRFVGAGPPIPPGGSVSYRVFSQLYSGEPSSILSLLDPQRYSVPDGNELYIGLAALVVVVCAALALRSSLLVQIGRYRFALIATGLMGALAMLGPWTPFPAVLYELPFVTEVRELGRYSIMIHLVLCLLVAFALQALGTRWLRATGAGADNRRRWLIAAVLGVLVALDGLFLILRPLAADGGWFGVQLLLSGVALLVLAAPLRGSPVPLAPLLGVVIIASSLLNVTRLLGSTSSPLYPPRYYARTAAISFAERACAGHRTLVLDNALPTNVGDVYRRLRTQNGYGATMHQPFFDFINSSSWTGPEETRLLDLRCIAGIKPITLPGYRAEFHDAASGVTIYVDDRTSQLNTPLLQPVPVTVTRDDDRDKRYVVQVNRATTVILSAIVYPGWQLQVDGKSAPAASFRVGNVPVFPEVTLTAGQHTLEYSWSGWPG